MQNNISIKRANPPLSQSDSSGNLYLIKQSEKLFFFLNICHPEEGIFLTTFYGLYFSHQLQITFLHDIDLLWAAIHVLHQHLSFWLVGTP